MEPGSSPLFPVPTASDGPHLRASGGPPPTAASSPGAPAWPLSPDAERPDRDVPQNPPVQRSWLRRKLSAWAAALLALLAKLKAILLLLPQIKILATAGTMAVSIVAYGSIWGFAFGAGFVGLIFVHEMGHVIALRREGVKASAPIFIPFLGAVIGSRSLGEDALAEARVGLAGPILGSIGSAACLLVWKQSGHTYWQALAYTGFLLNLFNLIPVVPLDGGRAMAAMSPWLWPIGFIGLVALAFIDPNPVFVLVLILAAFEIYRRWRAYRSGQAMPGYYRVAAIDRVLIGAVYLSLIALLAVGMHATELHRSIL